MATRKTAKLWATRYERESINCGQYILCRGMKPRRTKHGTWPNMPGSSTWDKARTRWRIRERDFEKLFPEQFHLPLGGGPVLIRFADEV